MASVRTSFGTVFAAGLFFLVGCGGNSLDGSWTTTFSASGSMVKETIDLKDDMTASATAKIPMLATGTCTGSLEYTGYDWSSTETTITFSGNSTCKSSLVCMVAGQSAPIGCTPQTDVAGVCHYKLTNGDNTLEVSECSANSNLDQTYTRVD